MSWLTGRLLSTPLIRPHRLCCGTVRTGKVFRTDDSLSYRRVCLCGCFCHKSHLAGHCYFRNLCLCLCLVSGTMQQNALPEPQKLFTYRRIRSKDVLLHVVVHRPVVLMMPPLRGDRPYELRFMSEPSKYLLLEWIRLRKCLVACRSSPVRGISDVATYKLAPFVSEKEESA